MNTQALLKGAVGGLLAALAVDVHSWSQSGGKDFDWKLALGRWIGGAIIGAATAFGVGA